MDVRLREQVLNSPEEGMAIVLLVNRAKPAHHIAPAHLFHSVIEVTLTKEDREVTLPELLLMENVGIRHTYIHEGFLEINEGHNGTRIRPKTTSNLTSPMIRAEHVR